MQLTLDEVKNLNENDVLKYHDISSEDNTLTVKILEINNERIRMKSSLATFNLSFVNYGVKWYLTKEVAKEES